MVLTGKNRRGEKERREKRRFLDFPLLLFSPFSSSKGIDFVGNAAS
jgi:hypothetical protein